MALWSFHVILCIWMFNVNSGVALWSLHVIVCLQVMQKIQLKDVVFLIHNLDTFPKGAEKMIFNWVLVVWLIYPMMKPIAGHIFSLIFSFKQCQSSKKFDHRILTSSIQEFIWHNIMFNKIVMWNIRYLLTSLNLTTMIDPASGFLSCAFILNWWWQMLLGWPPSQLPVGRLKRKETR